jgi:hypothetical protein
LRVSILSIVVCRLLALIVLVCRHDRAKELEILVLRHELSVLRRQANRPRFEPQDRLVLAAFSRMLPRCSWSAFLVRSETLLHRHRRLVARRWTYPHRPPGRPRIEASPLAYPGPPTIVLVPNLAEFALRRQGRPSSRERVEPALGGDRRRSALFSSRR